jgi:hypothetical protein
MTTTVAGEEEHASASEFAFDNFIRGRAEGSFNGVGSDDFQRVDLIKAGATDDGERGWVPGVVY